MIRARNIDAGLVDRLITIPVDFSADLTNDGKTVFIDFDRDYDLVSAEVKITTAYIGSQAVSFDLGVDDDGSGTADVDYFVDAQSLGTSAIGKSTKVVLTQTSQKKLTKGTGLTVTFTHNASQTGEGVLSLRLRPFDKAAGAASKVPTRAT